MIKEPYNNIYGLWNVTTEGDCEGRSVCNLGVYEGNIDEIAFALADKCYYCLNFRAVSPKNYTLDMTPKSKTVDIQLDIGSGTWDMDKGTRVVEVGNLMKNRPVDVIESNFYGCVRLVTNNKTIEEKKAEALAKLSLEERKLLGLIKETF